MRKFGIEKGGPTPESPWRRHLRNAANWFFVRNDLQILPVGVLLIYGASLLNTVQVTA